MNKSMVPGIRFAGFEDEWGNTLLGELASIGNGRDYQHLNTGTIPVYGTGGLITYVDGVLSEHNDAIGIGRKGTIDQPYILKAPFWTVDTLFYVIPGDGVDLNFLFGEFQRIDWRSKNEATGVPSLTSRAIARTKFPITTSSEQRSVGAFFARLDELVEQRQAKHERLKRVKTALLQKMFPRSGATEPELRIAGFSETWERVELGELARFINGRAYSQSELLDHGKYLVVRVGNFYTNEVSYFSDLELDDDFYIDQGDLIYTWSATFGPHIWNGPKSIYHYHIWKIIVTKGVDKLFLQFLLEKDKENILATNNGSTMPHITKEGMERKQVLVPPSLPEQQAIGSFFAQLDELITTQNQFIAKLQQVKSALLEKMFV